MRTTPLFFVLALAACAGSADEDTDDTDDTDANDTDGDDTDDGSGDEALVGCVAVSTEPVTDLDAVPEGFAASVATMLAGATGTFTGDLTLAAGGSVSASLVVTRTGDVVVERRDWVDDGGQEVEGGPEPALAEDVSEPGSGGDTAEPPPDTGLVDVDGCRDVIRFAATLDLNAGTALDETFTSDVRVDTSSAASFFGGLALDALVGDAAPVGFDPDDMAEVALQISAAQAAPGAWDLDLSFFGASEPDVSGPDGVVSATNDPWAAGTLSLPAE